MYILAIAETAFLLHRRRWTWNCLIEMGDNCRSLRWFSMVSHNIRKEFNKGDPYIRDMKKTSGHIASLTGCQWNPCDPSVFLTSSLDSTIRIWDVDVHRYQRTVIVARAGPGSWLSGAVTAAKFSGDGKLVFGGNFIIPGGLIVSLPGWKS
jgi:WD40 repeat protein